MIHFLAAIQFDPNIRGILVVLVGVVVLVGSVYLLLATNVGVRQGFLIAMAGLFGWMASMGAVWWVYGIGLRGRDPSWIVKEVNYSRADEVVTESLRSLPPNDDLPDPETFLADYLAKNPAKAEQIAATEGEGFRAETLTEAVTAAPTLKKQLDPKLGGWRILPESDSRRGDAAANADAAIVADKVFGETTASGMYTVKDVFFYGGKIDSEPETIPGERNIFDKAWRRVKTIFEPKNPALYAAVTVQKNLTQVVAPGEAPPPAQVDPKADTVTILLLRDLGTRRLIPALFTVFSTIIFAVLVWMLHNRDKEAMRRRAEWADNKSRAPAKVG